MGAFDSKVSDIKNELNDWLNVRGGEVADLAVSLINRAIQELWMYRPWDLLRKTSTLALDASNQAMLPTDYGRILLIGYDSNADGILDWFFSCDCRDEDKRYEFVTSFSKSTGYVVSVKFAKAPSYTPQLRYVVGLEKVTEDSDYLFFPASLVLRKAQKIHATDKSISGLEVNAINNDYNELLRDYEQAYYHIDRSMESFQQDKYFNVIDNNGYSLDGNVSGRSPNWSNSRDI